MSAIDATELAPWADDARKHVLVLSSTPRGEGNSRRLAEAVVEGATMVGHDTRLVDLSAHMGGFLRDCRQCRGADGLCTIDDGHGRIFLDLFVPADAIVYASPIWWYGMSGQLKAFLDRMFCYASDSYPDVARVMEAMPGKRVAAVLSAEESNFSARLGITTQLSELCRYLHHELVSIVVGIGNSRSEVRNDPSEPLESARILGQRLFEIRPTDYQLDSVRPKRIWQDGPHPYPAYWR